MGNSSTVRSMVELFPFFALSIKSLFLEKREIVRPLIYAFELFPIYAFELFPICAIRTISALPFIVCRIVENIAIKLSDIN